jgi:hypothetical protein
MPTIRKNSTDDDKAQVRLCARYRRLSAAGTKPPMVVAAIAHEMAALLWAIGERSRPRSSARSA